MVLNYYNIKTLPSEMGRKDNSVKERLRGCWDTQKTKLNYSSLNTIDSGEQELILNSVRDEEVINVSCSYGKWITKLKKNKHFTVNEALISSTNGRVLQVRGTLPKNSLTIRRVLKCQ